MSSNTEPGPAPSSRAQRELCGLWGSGGPPTCSIVFRSASLSRCQPLKEGGSSGVCIPTHGGVSAARGPTCHRGRVSSPFPRTGGRAHDHSAGVTRERWVGCELGALAGGRGPGETLPLCQPQGRPTSSQVTFWETMGQDGAARPSAFLKISNLIRALFHGKE